MKIRIQQWKDSLAVRIPKALADEIGLQVNDEVEMTLQDGQIILSPMNKIYSLEELLKAVSQENYPDEWDMGSPVGNEVW